MHPLPVFSLPGAPQDGPWRPSGSCCMRGVAGKGKEGGEEPPASASHPHCCHPLRGALGCDVALPPQCPSRGGSNQSQPQTWRPQAGSLWQPHDPLSWRGSPSSLGLCQHPPCWQRQGHGSTWSLARASRTPWQPPGLFLARRCAMPAKLPRHSSGSCFHFLPPASGGKKPAGAEAEPLCARQHVPLSRVPPARLPQRGTRPGASRTWQGST